MGSAAEVPQRPAFGHAPPPPTAAQVLSITPVARCFDTANKYNSDSNSKMPGGCSANRALIETMDKDAIRAWPR